MAPKTTHHSVHTVYADPSLSASHAGLRYLPDTKPGITRTQKGKKSVYLTAKGEPVSDEKSLERINKLVIPPAWTDVWICPSPNGHIQATGRDQKGRKQYIYHQEWQQTRNLTKFGRMIAFGEMLPAIRKQIEKDLELKELSRRKITAIVLNLLDQSLIRIGNRAYAKSNKSYGLTTLRDKHVSISGAEIKFEFVGKKGVAHAKRINGKVMMLEEKFDGKESLIPTFGKATDLVESDEVLQNRFEKNNYRIDQKLFARSRLFDILIGDWDRHEGQWQWAEVKTGKDVLYRPIPKDRDQAFYRFDDGLVPWLASTRFTLKKFQTFRKNYGYLPGLLFNARFIDARALNEVTREEWIQFANEIKTNLTDNLIESAVRKFPEAVYAKEGKSTELALKNRRDELPKAAEKIYKILAKEVTVAGTDQEEKFVVERLPNGNTKVEVFTAEEDGGKTFYSRVFKPSETNEIILHGLRGKDEFVISGKAKSAIELKVFGGEGEDKLTDTSDVKSWSKKTKVFDTKRGIEMEMTKEVKKRLTHSPEVHAYDREGL